MMLLSNQIRGRTDYWVPVSREHKFVRVLILEVVHVDQVDDSSTEKKSEHGDW
jgi:hypothetical protein